MHHRPPILEFQNVGLEIPILSTETRSLKASLLRSVTGGKLKKRGDGAVVTALDDINLTILQGGRVALIGHNGAGKSTFATCFQDLPSYVWRFKAMCRYFP